LYVTVKGAELEEPPEQPPSRTTTAKGAATKAARVREAIRTFSRGYFSPRPRDTSSLTSPGGLLFSRTASSFVRVAALTIAVLAVLAGCSSGGGGSSAPTVPPGQADPTGWNKASIAAGRALANKVDKGLGCTGFGIYNRADYVKGLKRVHGPVPDAVVTCKSLDEDLEISMFSSSSVRDNFVNNRRDKICAISKRTNVGLPGLYWVVGGDWSIQPDSEGVARRVAQVLHARYEATGCNGTNPGWDPTAVATLEQTASKLKTNRLGCVDIQMQDRDLVAKTVPFDAIGTPAATANCTLSDGSTIVLSAYNTPAAKTDALIRGEMGRECTGGNAIRIVRAGNVALFASTPAVADKLKNAVGGSLSPVVCKGLK
jgi:hypothetical protein